MEKQLFKTLMKNTYKNVGRDGMIYIEGVISGIMRVTCVDFGEKSYAHKLTEEGTILTCNCSPLQYKYFTEQVKNDYPGLCEFYYEG